MKQTNTLVSSKPLRRKASLKAKPAATKKRRSLAEKTAQQLIKEADKWFSKYIRLRDSDYADGVWRGTCVTCGRAMVVYQDGKWTKGPQNGHMIGRGTFCLRYSEINCNLQCAHCNAWLDKDEMITRYRKAVDAKYGAGTYEELKAESQREDALKRPTKPELLQIIHDAKLRIDIMLREC